MNPLPVLLLGLDWLDPEHILDQFGDYALWGAAAVIFAECGILIGFFLPGDSLLFTVGLLVAQDKISYPLWLCVPVVRTFITVMAGVGTMSFRRFMIYSAVGGALWAIGVTLLGYYLGTIPFVANNVEVMLLAFVAIAIIPVAVEYLRDRAARKLDEVTSD